MNAALTDRWTKARQRGLTEEGVLLIVRVAEQDLSILAGGQMEKVFPVSTSRFGIGSEKGSHKTPAGFHDVVEWIGGHLPLGSVLKSRVPTGEVLPETEWRGQRRDDLILSRILRLNGLEDGVNRGGDLDSFNRYIYLHGTNQEQALGTAASAGCIRVGNRDVAHLFDRTNQRSTWCWIV